MGGNGVGFGDRYGVTPTPKTIDEGIPTFNQHPDLQVAVDVSQGRGLLHGVLSLLVTPGLRLHH
jgi:hypothetical protein